MNFGRCESKGAMIKMDTLDHKKFIAFMISQGLSCQNLARRHLAPVYTHSHVHIYIPYILKKSSKMNLLLSFFVKGSFAPD